MLRKKSYFIIGLLVLLGLALVVIPNGMRFTGWFLLGAGVVWIVGDLLARWA